MNKLISISQIKKYKSQPLSRQTHQILSQSLCLFKPNQQYSRLRYTWGFSYQSLPFVHEKMSRIGVIADEIDHHPEWTLKKQHLIIQLSTHDIGNKISVKDYYLAQWIQKLLKQDCLENQLVQHWNSFQFNLPQLQ